MSISSNVTEEDLINLRKLAEQQKQERALKIKNRILKETHNKKLAESLSPITEPITERLDKVNKSAKKLDSIKESFSPINEKLDTINESTQKVGDIIKESNAENNKETIITPSILLKDTFKSLAETPSSLKLNHDINGNFSILGTNITPLGGDKVQVYDKNYEFNPELHSALSKPSYTGNSMKNQNDKRTLYNFLTDVGYTGVCDEKTSQSRFFKRLLKQYRNIKKEEPANLKGQGVKIIIPSNIIDIYTRLEVLLGLKLSGHSDTLTEASNLIDELYKRGEIQNKHQYRNALNKFSI